MISTTNQKIAATQEQEVQLDLPAAPEQEIQLDTLVTAGPEQEIQSHATAEAYLNSY